MSAVSYATPEWDYEVQRAEAQHLANATGLDVGLYWHGGARDAEPWGDEVIITPPWMVIVLPAKPYRQGIELQCEVISPTKGEP